MMIERADGTLEYTQSFALSMINEGNTASSQERASKFYLASLAASVLDISHELTRIRESIGDLNNR